MLEGHSAGAESILSGGHHHGSEGLAIYSDVPQKSSSSRGMNAAMTLPRVTATVFKDTGWPIRCEKGGHREMIRALRLKEQHGELNG